MRTAPNVSACAERRAKACEQRETSRPVRSAVPKHANSAKRLGLCGAPCQSMRTARNVSACAERRAKACEQRQTSRPVRSAVPEHANSAKASGAPRGKRIERRPAARQEANVLER